MKKYKNQQGGFLELIIVLVLAILLMRYYGLTITGVWAWIKDFVLSVW